MDKLSKSNQFIIEAARRGYKIINNQLINPQGKILKHKTRTKTGKWGKSYTWIYVVLSLDGKQVPIIVARFIAYLKFGVDLFQPGILVRHKDNNSLNNEWDNIVLGNRYDNYYDIPLEERLATNKICATKKRKLTDNQIRDIQIRVIIFKEDREKLEKEYNVSSAAICGYVNWKFNSLNWVKFFYKKKCEWVLGNARGLHKLGKMYSSRQAV